MSPVAAAVGVAEVSLSWQRGYWPEPSTRVLVVVASRWLVRRLWTHACCGCLGPRRAERLAERRDGICVRIRGRGVV